MLIALRSDSLAASIKGFFVLAATECGECHEVFYIAQSRDLNMSILHAGYAQELKERLAREHASHLRHGARYDFEDGGMLYKPGLYDSYRILPESLSRERAAAMATAHLLRRAKALGVPTPSQSDIAAWRVGPESKVIYLSEAEEHKLRQSLQDAYLKDVGVRSRLLKRVLEVGKIFVGAI
jgi:hypothetical protein